jgi:hypothetical protein
LLVSFPYCGVDEAFDIVVRMTIQIDVAKVWPTARAAVQPNELDDVPLGIKQFQTNANADKLANPWCDSSVLYYLVKSSQIAERRDVKRGMRQARVGDDRQIVRIRLGIDREKRQVAARIAANDLQAE